MHARSIKKIHDQGEHTDSWLFTLRNPLVDVSKNFPVFQITTLNYSSDLIFYYKLFKHLL